VTNGPDPNRGHILGVESGVRNTVGVKAKRGTWGCGLSVYPFGRPVRVKIYGGIDVLGCLIIVVVVVVGNGQRRGHHQCPVRPPALTLYL